jgi:hypothetical protein
MGNPTKNPYTICIGAYCCFIFPCLYIGFALILSTYIHSNSFLLHIIKYVALQNFLFMVFSWKVAYMIGLVDMFGLGSMITLLADVDMDMRCLLLGRSLPCGV